MYVETLSDRELQKKLRNLESAYFLINDQVKRMEALLIIDDIKLELIKRGIYDPS